MAGDKTCDSVSAATVSIETYLRDSGHRYELMDTHLNRETVDHRLARLRDEYGSFPVIDSQAELPADRFDDLLKKATEGYTGGGYAWTVREPEDAPSLSNSMPGRIDQSPCPEVGDVEGERHLHASHSLVGRTEFHRQAPLFRAEEVTYENRHRSSAPRNQYRCDRHPDSAPVPIT
ncbi:MAG: hypothetical protein ACI9PP_002009 [Halobacteriales archaeon]